MNRFHLFQVTLTIMLAFLLFLFPITNRSPKFNLFLSTHSQSNAHPVQEPLGFNGSRAFTYLEEQCAFGPRPPGSSNLTECGNYIITTLEDHNWSVLTQSWSYQNTQLRNIMAGELTYPQYVILAHYDTRPIADRDPNLSNRLHPILGANDGASGVAALLELAQVLPEAAKTTTMLLFVDAEDSGNYDDWEWIVGSTHFVNSLSPTQKSNIRATILLDMVGDTDLQLPKEQFSTPILLNAVWQFAAELGYHEIFLNTNGLYLIDDHSPFLDVGIPAIDIIDFTYPYWHTLEDTPDKCSAESLEVVGRVVEAFIEAQLTTPTDFRYDGPFGLSPLQLILLITIPILIIGAILSFVYRQKFQLKTI